MKGQNSNHVWGIQTVKIAVTLTKVLRLLSFCDNWKGKLYVITSVGKGL